MIIETAYNIGDTVWFEKDNKPYEGQVGQIEFVTNDPDPNEVQKWIKYRVDYIYDKRQNQSTFVRNLASELFTTKQALLESELQKVRDKFNA